MNKLDKIDLLQIAVLILLTIDILISKGIL